MKRLCAADLGATPDAQDVELRGRRFAALLVDATGQVAVAPWPTDARDGALVRVAGRWNALARVVEARSVEVVEGTGVRADGNWRGLNLAGVDERAPRVRRLPERARIMRALRAFFDDAGFVEVETPLVVPSPGMDLHLDAMRVDAGERGPTKWLVTSPEYQMKRLLAGGLDRIYQVCRCFRRAELGRHHHPEFSMLEWYRAWSTSEPILADTENLVAHLATTLYGAPRLRFAGRDLDVRPPWPRLTVREAFARYAAVSMDDVLADEERFFRLLVERIEPELGLEKPTWLVRWPISMASLARAHEDDPSVADRFEAYVAGVELCNGFGELTDVQEQARRFGADRRKRAALGKDVYALDEELLGALEEGMPPSGGNALGVDRLVMMLLDAGSIDEVVAIPPSRLGRGVDHWEGGEGGAGDGDGGGGTTAGPSDDGGGGLR